MNNIITINKKSPEPELIFRAAKILQKGGVIAYPTETVYGIGCNIFDDKAVNRIYTIKQRDKGKALIVIAADIIQISDIVESIPEEAEKLIENFWPGPLTIVFETSSTLKEFPFGKSKTIAIRIPDNPICLSLLKISGFPIVSTSANISGQPSATKAQQVFDQFGSELDLIIDGGEALTSQPSTVIDITKTPPRILREGAITPLEISTVIDINI
ncbi:MAG TPA: L-threonylcarbamoyladenylate synthase [bacterium]|nr:L-threonylcarbamoyladenylate synthase [bacterium]HPN44294.1 L-threonylcarbamoyladenylate synthase [bacterium]